MKYAELIRAALDGKEIQYRWPGNDWMNYSSRPSAIQSLAWYERNLDNPPELRVAPPPDRVLWQNVYNRRFGKNSSYTETSASSYAKHCPNVRTNVAKWTFDGLSGVVKSVELIPVNP